MCSFAGPQHFSTAILPYIQESNIKYDLFIRDFNETVESCKKKTLFFVLIFQFLWKQKIVVSTIKRKRINCFRRFPRKKLFFNIT